MNIYLLTAQQTAALQALNTDNIQFVPCDHGSGLCVGATDLDAPEFSEHKALLDSWGLSITYIEISGGLF